MEIFNRIYENLDLIIGAVVIIAPMVGIPSAWVAGLQAIKRVADAIKQSSLNNKDVVDALPEGKIHDKMEKHLK